MVEENYVLFVVLTAFKNNILEIQQPYPFTEALPLLL